MQEGSGCQTPLGLEVRESQAKNEYFHVFPLLGAFTSHLSI